MGVKYGADVLAAIVDGAVEWVLAGGLVAADNCAVGLDADDVVARQRTLVNAAGADPHVAVFVDDGDVAAARRRHAAVIDALHELDNLVLGVDVGVGLHGEKLNG